MSTTNSNSVFTSLNNILTQSKGGQQQSSLPSVVEENNQIVEYKENVESKDRSQELNDDFEFTREVLKDLIKKGQELLLPILKEAQTTAHPRNVEAANRTIQEISSNAKSLMELHEKVTKVNSPPSEGVKETKTIEKNNTVVITTLDLLELDEKRSHNVFEHQN